VMAPRDFGPLVESAWLEEHLQKENLRIFDTTSFLIVPSIVLLVSLLGSVIFALWNSIVRMGKTGQSLGRKFLNIAVLDENGQPIGTGRAFLREVIGRWVSSLICYIGYLNAFWDARKQMWHDKMANCFVYYVDDNFS